MPLLKSQHDQSGGAEGEGGAGEPSAGGGATGSVAWISGKPAACPTILAEGGEALFLLLGEGGFRLVGGKGLLEEVAKSLGSFEVGAGLGVGLQGLFQGFAVGGGKGFAEGVGGEVFGVHKMKVCSCSVFGFPCGSCSGLSGRFEGGPFLAEGLDAVVDEVADVADGGVHGLADLLVVESGDELQFDGFALALGELGDEAVEFGGGFAVFEVLGG